MGVINGAASTDAEVAIGRDENGDEQLENKPL